jgi:hypothetical protein
MTKDREELRVFVNMGAIFLIFLKNLRISEHLEGLPDSEKEIP